MKHSVRILGQQVLVFPVLVTVLVALAFVFGGACAAWQWWGAFWGVMAYPFFWYQRKEALVADAVFVALNLLLFVAISFYTDTYWNCDYPDYHLPAIRLMIEGWNPVYDHDLTEILARLKLEPWDMRYSHIVFCQKAVWMFNAAAYKFHHQVFAVSWALNPLVLMAAAFAVFEYCRVRSWHWSLGVLFVTLNVFCCTFGTPVDDVVCYAATGLLCTMAANYFSGRFDWWRLGVFSFWMMNSKSVALLSCFVFWVVFSVAFCIKFRAKWKRAVRDLSLLGSGLIVLLALVAASPIVTSAIHYGHPLYPQMTSRPDVYPVKDLAWTFRVGNAGEVRLDVPCAFLKSYISPWLAEKYRDLTGRVTNAIPPGLPLLQRLMILAAIFILLSFSHLRMTGSQLLLGLICFPWQGMGVMRYMPWAWVLVSFAVVALIGECVGKKHLVWMALVIAGFIFVKQVPGLVLGEVYGFGETECGLDGAAESVYAYSFDLNPRTDVEMEELTKKFSFVPRQSKLGHSTINNIKLLFRERYGYYPTVIPTPESYLRCDKTFYRGGYCRLPSHEFREVPLREKVVMALCKFIPYVRVCLRDVAFRVAANF